MSQISVTINGRQFRMSCEDGQEDHLMSLARELDARIDGLRTKFGEIGDTRLTVMAALTVADTLSETSQRLKRLESEMVALQEGQAEASKRGETAEATVVAALVTAAERVEDIVKKLNHSAVGAGGVAMG